MSTTNQEAALTVRGDGTLSTPTEKEHITVDGEPVRAASGWISVADMAEAIGYATAGPVRRLIDDDDIELRHIAGQSLAAARREDVLQAARSCTRSTPELVRELMQAAGQESPNAADKAGGVKIRPPESASTNPILQELAQLCAAHDVAQDIDAGKLAFTPFARDLCGYSDPTQQRRKLETKSWEFEKHTFDYGKGGRQSAYAIDVSDAIQLVLETKPGKGNVDELRTAIKKWAGQTIERSEPAPVKQTQIDEDRIAQAVAGKVTDKIMAAQDKRDLLNADGERFLYAEYADEPQTLREIAMNKVRHEAAQATGLHHRVVTSTAYELVRTQYHVDLYEYQKHEGLEYTIDAAQAMHSPTSPVLLYVIDVFNWMIENPNSVSA